MAPTPAATPTARRRTQAERSAATEAALLKAAAEVIAEVGVERASLRSIGARAGVSRAMPAYHFGSKDALAARLVEHATAGTFDAAAARLSADRDLDELSCLELLRGIIATYLETFTDAGRPEERAVVVMWGATFPSSSAVPQMVEVDRHTHGDLRDTIVNGQQDGSIPGSVDVDAAALVIMGLARGAAALLLTLPTVARADAVRALCDRAITAVLAESVQR